MADQGEKLVQLAELLRQAAPDLSEKKAMFGAGMFSMVQELGLSEVAMKNLQSLLTPGIPYAARDAIHRVEMDQARARMAADAMRATALDGKQQQRERRPRERLGDLTVVGLRAIFFYLERHPDFKPRSFSDAKKIQDFAVKHDLPGAERLNPEAAFGKLVQAAAEGRLFAPVAPQKKKA
jgi:hypothetical protein